MVRRAAHSRVSLCHEHHTMERPERLYKMYGMSGSREQQESAQPETVAWRIKTQLGNKCELLCVSDISRRRVLLFWTADVSFQDTE